jgi:hypothetical protein
MAAVAGPSRPPPGKNQKQKGKDKPKVHAHQAAKQSEKARIDALERAVQDYVRPHAHTPALF